jgi:twitching motility protein PilU
VILIGEIRDRETMEHAIAFAETGHLAISTLHANNANQAMDRIINFFPEERRNQLLLDLSLNLRAFVSQRLIPTIDNKRCAAIEILLGTPLVCESIKRGEVGELKEIMEKSINLGMKTFDVALFELYKAGRITLEEALRNADSANNLRLKINLSEGEGAATSAARATESASGEASDDTGGLSLVTDEPAEEEPDPLAQMDPNKANFKLAD